MKLSRDVWLAIGLVLVLLIVTFAAILQQSQREEAPPYASFSSAPEGSRALRLWLEQLGYTISETGSSRFQPPPEAGLIFILQPQPPITPEEWETLDTWVEAGGTLILAGDSLGAILAVRHYRFNLTFGPNMTTTLITQTPLLDSPPPGPVEARPRAYFETDRSDFVTHLAVASGPVLLSFAKGEGRVILGAAPYPFSNAGLKESGNAALVLNLVGAAPQINQIWFDEWHHGVRHQAVEIVGPANWLRYTPPGHSLLYSLLVVFVALILWGRHFGAPVPLAQETGRRAPLEYITAIANLSRRVGHRSAVLSRYHHRLKRGLGQRYRLNPTLPDNEFVDRLSRFRPDLDVVALRRLLAQLRHPDISESEMLRLAIEVSTWLKEV